MRDMPSNQRCWKRNKVLVEFSPNSGRIWRYSYKKATPALWKLKVGCRPPILLMITLVFLFSDGVGMVAAEFDNKISKPYRKYTHRNEGEQDRRWWYTRGFEYLTLFLSYHVVSCRVVSYRIVSYRIVSYHIISYHIISYHSLTQLMKS